MKTLKHIIRLAMISSAAMLAVAATIGCRTVSGDSSDPSLRQSSQTMDQSGAQLWAENCARCHNFRSPSSYGDAEWDVAMHHMRVRANLTAQEHSSIVNFLKSGN